MGILAAIFFFVVGVWLMLNHSKRTAYETYLDLLTVEESEDNERISNIEIYKGYALPFFTAAGIILICTLLGRSNPATLIPAAIVGLSGCYIVQQKLIKRAQQIELQDIEYSLPIIMERLVMAAEAGLDVIPALKVVVSFDRKRKESKADVMTPLTNLLNRVIVLSEQGLSFERSLSQVARSVNSKSVHHAFIHLGMAFREGGELLGPLRELSDSTQLLYQETVEEEIAKLPVKATLPLVVVFAGLVLCIMAMPLVQILTFTGELMLNGK